MVSDPAMHPIDVWTRINIRSADPDLEEEEKVKKKGLANKKDTVL
jgi:hypothetical protein